MGTLCGASRGKDELIMKKRIIPSLALIMTILLLAGCGGTAAKQEVGTAPASSPGQKQTVIDLAGREVELTMPVQRVVAIGPGALRLVVYAQGESLVVGIEESEKKLSLGRAYMMAYPELKELPGIGQGGPDTAPNEESLVSVHPDVIFVSTLVDKEKADQLQAKTGIPVVVLSYSNGTKAFDDSLYTSLTLLGKIIGKEKRGEEVVAYLKQNERDLTERTKDVPENDKVKVYVGAISMKGAHGIESTQAQYPPLMVIGANNVVDETGKSGSFMIDKEKLVSWDPDILFIDAAGYALVREDYQKNPVFYNSLQAVKNGQVYNMISFNSYAANIDTAFADAYFAGKIVFPKQFENVDPVRKSDEIYQFLLGKPLYQEMAKVLRGFVKLELGK